VSVPPPNYWPCYYELTSEQRYKYFEFLQDPYSGNHDIGYVFLFFYGLERQLEGEKHIDAFNTIIRLRDVYSNNSFRCYSLISLLHSCIEHNRDKLFFELYERCELMNDFTVYIDLYMLSKNFLRLPFNARDLVMYRKNFGDTSKNLPDDPDSYEIVVAEKMLEVFGTSEINITDILYKDKQVELYDTCMYQNLSLQNLRTTIPNFLKSTSFCSKCETVLQSARNAYAKPNRKTPSEQISFTHGDLILNEKEEIFYRQFVFEIANVWTPEELLVTQRNRKLYFDDKYGGIGWIKLTGRKFQIGICDMVIESAYGIEYSKDSIAFYDIESVDHALTMIEKMVKFATIRKEFRMRIDKEAEQLY
jgi:hypothetical protein